MSRHGENNHKQKDGRWEARIKTGTNANNKTKFHSVYGSTYEEVKKKKESYINNSKNKEETPLTFSQAAEEWLVSKKGKVKNTTFNHYYNQYYLHIHSIFENRIISSIKAEEYDRFLLNLEENSYSSRTITLLRTIIKMILKYAERKYNVNAPEAKEMYMPKKPGRHVQAFTKPEQAKIDRYFADHLDNYALAVMFSMYCGLRIGEVCALQWNDVDLKNGIVTVSKTLIRMPNKETDSYSKTKIITQKPKTESSRRKVPIPYRLIPVLTNKFSNYPSETYVITGTAKYMEPRVCLRKFKRIMEELNLNGYTFHACRHTYATRCVEVGIDAKILSELLGHSSVKTTLDRYVHPSMDIKKDQVNKLTLQSD